MEDLGRSLLFARPRRFGKSLWIHTLSSYYDARRRDEHDRLFGGLAVGRDPTPLAVAVGFARLVARLAPA